MSQRSLSIAASARGPLPLVIGVTGHRDLRPEDMSGLEAAIEAIFKETRERYPHTPLVVLSMLADGADRMVARIGLRFGASLVVPLPLPLELYEQDFDTPESLAEFESLLAQADEVFVLPLVTGNTLESVSVYGEPRNHQYALVGAFMARTSQMLIALWDGTDNGKTGGTAQVVSFKLHDVPEIYAETLTTSSGSMRSHLDAVEVGPVYHIVTPRVSSAEVPDSPLTVTKRFRHIEHNSSDEASESSYDRTYANIDAFNADALLAETEPGLKAHVEQSKSYLIPEEELQTLPASLKSICQDFGVADALANHYKERTLQLLYLLFGIVFVAAVTLEIYSDIQDKMHLLLVFYPLLLGVAYIPWYFGLKQRKWQDRHQDYRALAEGLRVEFFWQLADLPTSVADHYLRKQKSELDWIRIAIRSADCIWNPPVGKVEHHGASAPVDPETIRRLELVEKRWVQDQCKYYARAAPRDQRESERIERWVKRLLASSPIFAFVWGILLLIPKIDAFVDDHKLHGFMMLSVVIPALVGASLHTYADKRALAQQAKQYKRMQVLFDTAARRMAEYMQHHRYTHAQELVKELGKEALAENGDWVLTHRERPVEVPQG